MAVTSSSAVATCVGTVTNSDRFMNSDRFIAGLEIEVAGTVAGIGYDVLHASGTIQAGGVLVMQFTDGFAPKAGQ